MSMTFSKIDINLNNTKFTATPTFLYKLSNKMIGPGILAHVEYMNDLRVVIYNLYFEDSDGVVTTCDIPYYIAVR